MNVIPEVKKVLAGWKLGRVITVVDRGFCSQDNSRILQQTGRHYITGEKMTSGKPDVEAALAHPGRFRTIRDDLEVKEIVIGGGEARTRYVLVRNPEEARLYQCQPNINTGNIILSSLILYMLTYFSKPC
jgi:hypothetical protein